MKLSANQAAKEIGKSVPTITRAIKSGRLSAEERDGGGYLIDPAELFGVWPRVTPKGDAKDDTLNDTRPHDTRVLEVELKAERDMRAPSLLPFLSFFLFVFCACVRTFYPLFCSHSPLRLRDARQV